MQKNAKNFRENQIKEFQILGGGTKINRSRKKNIKTIFVVNMK